MLIFFRILNTIFCLTFLSIFIFPLNSNAAEPKSSVSTSTQSINIAIIDFVGKNVSAADASIVSDFVRTQMVNLGVFHVMDRNNMETILAEQKFQASGCTETECAVQMGKILNVQKMVVGSVSKLEGIYYISASIIDVETGKIEFSKTVQCYSANELKVSAEKLANQLASIKIGEKKIEYIQSELVKKDERSKVINVEKDKVTINKGFFDGIEERQMFDIYNENEKIAYMKIINVDKEKSTGKIIKRYSKNSPEIGNLAIYTGRKSKIGGIGLTVGYLSGKYKGLEFSGRHGEYGGGGIYYEFVAPSGLGFQVNLTIYKQFLRDWPWFGYEYYEGGYPYLHSEGSDIEYESNYYFPTILKYHWSYDTDFSPYIGLGFYYNSTKSKYSHSEYDSKYSYYTTTTVLWDEKNSGFSPVFNAGFEFFAKRFCHFSMDVKYFVGKKTPHFNSNAWVFSPAVSFHW